MREGASPGRVSGLVLNLFFEHSTRTRVSFEVASKRLGLDVVNFDLAASSIAKGETLADTVRTLDAMSPAIVVVRHSRCGVPEEVAHHTQASVVNAGDGTRAHPTQALLDALTLCDAFQVNRVEELAGKTVSVIGDIAHSRVVRSNLEVWRRAGIRVRLVGPRAFVPSGFTELGYEVHHDLARGLDDADVVYALRVQTERQSGCLYPSAHEYFRRFGLTRERLDRFAPHAVVMHPGPVNRNVELESSLMNDDRSLIDRQVANGIWVRMAVLRMLIDARKGLV